MSNVRDAATYPGHAFLDNEFLTLPTDTRYNKVDYHIVPPTTPAETSNTLTFVMPAVHDRIYKIADLEARVVCVIDTKPDTPLPKTELFAVTNNFLHSLIGNLSVTINNKLAVSASSQQSLYPYKAYLQTLLNFNSPSASSHLAAQGYTPEIAGAVETGGMDSDFEENSKCPGRYIRCQWFKKRPLTIKAAPNNVEQTTSATDYLDASQPMQFQGKLFTDMELCKGGLPPGVSVEIEIQKSTPEFYTLGRNALGDTFGFNIKTTSFDLVIPEAYLTPESHTNFMSKWKKQNVFLHTRPCQIHKFQIPEGASTENLIRNVYAGGKLPSLLVVGLVKHTAFKGEWKENPFNFLHEIDEDKAYLKEIVVRIGGKRVDEELTLTGTRCSDMGTFHRLMTALGVDRTNKSIGLNYDMFMNGSYLTAFDLSAGKHAAGQLLAPSVRVGQLDIVVHFSEKINTTLQAIVLGQMTGLITIDFDGNLNSTFLTA